MQKGGIEPNYNIPKFKYTFNQQRKSWVGILYPYADYFFTIIKLPFEEYQYSGNSHYIKSHYIKDIESEKTEEFGHLESEGKMNYNIFGGTVYLLHKKFSNVDPYKYCDPTGDIDIQLYPPKLNATSVINNRDYLHINFLNNNGIICEFWDHFTSWIYEKIVNNVQQYQSILNNIPGIVDFDINDYSDIQEKYKSEKMGYKVQLLGKIYVVAFFDDNMFRIQCVCKIIEKDIEIIDHFIEFIIGIEHENPEFSPLGEYYKVYTFPTLTIGGLNYNIQDYNDLIRHNVSAYISRKGVYGQSNEKEHIHKSINHIARLFYLFELFYQNQSLFDFKTILFLGSPSITDIPYKIPYMYYYKIVNNNFYTIQVDTKFFLTAYLELIKKTLSYNDFIRRNPNYFPKPEPDLKTIHDEFITKLFNDDLFLPKHILTATYTIGGRKSCKKKSTKRRQKKRRRTNKRRY